MLVPAALAATLLLTSCAGGSGGGDNTDASGEDCAPSGSASESVTVEGDFGGDLKMTGGTPVESTELERTVLIEGDGDRSPDEGAGVTAALSFFNGRTGDLVEHSPAGQPIVNSEQQLAPFAYEAVRCAVAGQRVVVSLPAEEAMGGAQSMPEGFEAGDAVVMVFDVESVEPGKIADEGELLPKAEGEAQDLPAGFPSVELADNGEPTITIPKDTDPPTELETATLIEGDGEEVQPGDRVYVNYRGVIWRTGEEFDSSWSRGAPTDFLTTGVIGGFTEALEGHTVGSQVISVVPADQEQGGYGADALEQQGHEPDDVMVFVLDIVGVVHAD
ncbi:FKBP-type peptidyl-prolyl cis-trans isomerase [Leucobacter tardus]